MNLKDKRFIILELIPTRSEPKNGDIAQISALKINKMLLEGRFDYRLDINKIDVQDIKDMINYDNDKFIYVNNTNEIIDKFKGFIENLPLLIIDNEYTKNYLKNIPNNKETVFKYLNLELSNDVFEKLIKKYSLEPSNYLVDLLYEALLREMK